MESSQVSDLYLEKNEQEKSSEQENHGKLNVEEESAPLTVQIPTYCEPGAGIGTPTDYESSMENNNVHLEHENIISLGILTFERRYGNHIKLDNNLLLQIVKEALEYIETFRRFSSSEKHIICKELIKRFSVNRGIKWSKINKTINNSISFIISISKHGLPPLKLDTKVVGDVQDIFNQIYPLVLQDVEKNYKNTDEIINHLFDICLVTMQFVENYPNINRKQRLILVKNIVENIIDAIPTFYENVNDEDLKLVKDNLDNTFILVELGFDAKDGQININIEDVEKIGSCLFKCCLSMIKKVKK
jgi:hypothetical protein